MVGRKRLCTWFSCAVGMLLAAMFLLDINFITNSKGSYEVKITETRKTNDKYTADENIYHHTTTDEPAVKDSDNRTPPHIVNSSYQERGALLVTGGMGSLGISIIRQLIESGEKKIKVVDLVYEDAVADTFALYPSLHGKWQKVIEYHRGDVRNAGLLRRLLVEGAWVRGVIHLAAVSQVIKCLRITCCIASISHSINSP